MSWTNADRIKNGSMPDKAFVQCTEFIRRAAVYIFVLHGSDPGNSVFAESEEYMKKDIVDTIIEEDFGRMIDLLLNTEDVRKAYQQEDGHTWIGCIGDGSLQEGLRHLDGQMLSIIESLVFEDMTIYEVSQHLCIDTDSVYKKIQESRRILLRYI